MKRFKKLLALMCVFACIFSLSACGKSDKKDGKDFPFIDYDKESFVEYVAYNYDSFGSLDKETTDMFIEEYKNSKEDNDIKAVEFIKQFKTAKKEFGEYQGLCYGKNDKLKYSMKIDGETITVKAKAKFKKRYAYITTTWKQDSTGVVITSSSIEGKYSLGEKMKTAGLNTAMGISIVVVVLAFLSVIISLFKFINIAQKAFEDRKNGKKNTPIDTAINQIVEKEENNEMDDTELVAVIAAAIAAAEETTVDGFVVRSIKKVPNRKWK